MPQIWGKFDGIDLNDKRLSEFDDFTIIFGADEFKARKVDPKDRKVQIFIFDNEVEYYVALRKGFVRVVNVTDASEFNMDSMIEFLNQSYERYQAIARFTQMRIMTAYLQDQKVSIDKFEKLVSAVYYKDTKALGELIAVGVFDLLKNVHILQDAMKMAMSFSSIMELEQAYLGVRKKYTEIQDELISVYSELQKLRESQVVSQMLETSKEPQTSSVSLSEELNDGAKVNSAGEIDSSEETQLFLKKPKTYGSGKVQNNPNKNSSKSAESSSRGVSISFDDSHSDFESQSNGDSPELPQRSGNTLHKYTDAEFSMYEEAYKDALKSLTEARSVISEKDEEMLNLNARIQELVDEKSSIEGALKVAEQKNAGLQSQIESMSKSVSEEKHNYDIKISSLTALLEQKRKEEESKSMEMTKHITTLSQDLMSMGQDKANLENRIKALEAELNENRLKLASASSDLAAAKEAYDNQSEDYKKVAEQIVRARALIKDYQTREDAVNKDLVIKKLREELQLATGSSINPEAISRQLPIISSDKMVLQCDKIVVFREIKPAVYLNTLASNLNDVCSTKLTFERNKSFIIIIFDLMTDQFRVFKYKKHKFAINSLPDLADNGNMIAVTNKIDMEFFRTVMKLYSFDYIFIFDRFGLVQPIVSHPKAFDFYLIDSTTDVTDFKLDRNKCLIYGKSDMLQFRGSIMPDGNLFDKDEEGRAFKMHQSRLIASLLADLKII